MGCTIRYEFGLFRQKLVDGYQIEVPDNWLDSGNIWEIPPSARDGRGALRRPRDSLRRPRPDALPPRELQRRRGRALRHPGARLRYDDGQHAAHVVGALAQAHRHAVVQLRPVRQGHGRARAGGGHLQDPLSERRQLSGQGAAAQAAVLLLVGVDPVCGQRLFEGLRPAVGHLPGQGRRAHQRHASGRGDPRADAHPDGRARPELGGRGEDLRQHLRLHESHRASGGARALARAALRRAAAAHLHDPAGDEQAAVRQAVGRLSRPVGAHRAHGDPRLQPGAHGEPVGRLFALGQRRVRHPHEHPQEADLPRLLQS